jgi:tRNA (Thr-GGU) A37 N-methylase
MMAAIVCQPIGLVRSRFEVIEGTPIQTAAAPNEAGEIIIFDQFAAGLADIEGFEATCWSRHRCSM